MDDGPSTRTDSSAVLDRRVACAVRALELQPQSERLPLH